MADWQAIKTEYITTDTSYRKLAEKYGISRVQVSNVGKSEGWVELRRQHLADTLSKTLDAVASAEAARTARILTLADKLLNKIEEMVDAVEAQDMNPKSVRSLTAAVKDLKEIQGVKSDLDKQEQEARIANLRKQAEKDEDKADVIEVVLKAGPEEWNE